MVTPRPSLLRTLAILACTLALCFFVTGCGISRAHYEKEAALPVMAEVAMPNGDTRVVYGPDHNPSIDPTTGVYTCQEGVRVITYRNGQMVSRWFQAHETLKP